MQTRFWVWNGGGGAGALGSGRIRGLVVPSGEIGGMFGCG